MNALIIYYSRTGNTRAAAEALAGRLECEIEELQDRRNRQGVAGYIRSGVDALRKRSADIAAIRADLSGYDLVVVGTPVWAFTVAPPVRTFLERYAADLERVAFFCTMGGSGAPRTFRAMEALARKTPSAVLPLTERDVTGSLGSRIQPFVNALQEADE